MECKGPRFVNCPIRFKRERKQSFWKFTSEIANELKIYIKEIMQNAAERDRTSGECERQGKGDGAQNAESLQQQCNCCYIEQCRNNDDSEGEKNNKEKSRFDEI